MTTESDFIACYTLIVTDQRADDMKGVKSTELYTPGVLFQHSKQISIVQTNPAHCNDRVRNELFLRSDFQ
jgi:hypothetical protein